MSTLYKRLTAVFVPIAIFALVGAGCSDSAQQALEDTLGEAASIGGGTDIGIETTTAAGIIDEVRDFLDDKVGNSDAILVGLNSAEDGFYITNFTPPTDELKNTDGKGARWFYIFAKNSGTLEDNELEKKEMLIVEFNRGKLRLLKDGDFFVISEDIYAVAGKDDWKIDTDQALQIMLDAIAVSEENESDATPSCMHVDYTMGTLHSYHFDDDDAFDNTDDRALVYDVTCYASDDSGWEAKIDATTGEITGVNPVEFSYSSF